MENIIPSKTFVKWICQFGRMFQDFQLRLSLFIFYLGECGDVEISFSPDHVSELYRDELNITINGQVRMGDVFKVIPWNIQIFNWDYTNFFRVKRYFNFSKNTFCTNSFLGEALAKEMKLDIQWYICELLEYINLSLLEEMNF